MADVVEPWHAQGGLQGTTIYAALVRRHDFTGRYSAARRFVSELLSPEDRA